MNINIKIFPETTVTRVKPSNLINKDNQLFKREFERTFKSVYTQNFQNIVIFANGAIVKKLILSDLYFCKSIQPKGLIKLLSIIKLYLNTFIHFLKCKSSVQINNAVLITNFHSTNYFHWLGDVLPKLEALEKLDINLSNYTFIVPNICDSNFARATLKAYDIDVKFLNINERAHVKHLLHIPNLTPTGNFRPNLMCRIRNKFSNHLSTTKNKRIYITRKYAAKRKIINEDEIIPVLKSFNFEIHAMETLTFQDQVNLLSDTEVLLSLHGAGLSNMLWMRENTKVMEIRSRDDHKNNVFYSLASALDIKYYYTFGDSIDKNLSTQKTDFIVSPKSLKEAIQNMLD